MSAYDEKFYENQTKESYESAKELISELKPCLPSVNKILDVGCGVGTWLKAWQESDKDIKILGIDGNDVDEKFFYIPYASYKRVDLTQNANTLFANLFTQNTNGGGALKPFDLLQSLEVAEHLPESAARNFIHFLTLCADVVLFSAAIPHQGGTEHINEQEPKYWAKIFKEFDYVCFDFLRTKIWDNEKIAFWYRQNVLLFVHKNKAEFFENFGFKNTESPLTFVHFDLLKAYFRQSEPEKRNLKFYFRHPKKIFCLLK